MPANEDNATTLRAADRAAQKASANFKQAQRDVRSAEEIADQRRQALDAATIRARDLREQLARPKRIEGAENKRDVGSESKGG